jgi:heme exporter protein D
MDLGPHAVFIWTAYGVTTAVIALLVARAILDERRQRKALVKLEGQGIRRRSASHAGDDTLS